MITFADILGYAFRKKVALTIERQAVAYLIHAQGPGGDELGRRAVQQPWTGGGAFDELVKECPFPFVAWVLTADENRVKIRGAMDISRLEPNRPIGIPHGIRADIWWRGMNLDVWLKTSMLTFNRLFPHEINRFVPSLCHPEELAKHLVFSSKLNLGEEFSNAYIAGLPPQERFRGAELLRAAEKLV